MNPMPGKTPNVRYGVDFWGKAWGRSIGGRGKTAQRKEAARDHAASGHVDLDRCRTLLITLDADDLRCRLSESPWCQSSVSAEESWLREAALAFETRTRAEGVWKTRDALVEDVLTAVQMA